MNERCIEWNGLRFSTGYGRLTNSERIRTGHLSAHRWIYEQFYGPIPPGLFVLHKCDNPPCVNPTHLRAGTPGDNIRDASAKGRLYNQKLTVCQRGHTFDDANTSRLGRQQKRNCRTCWNDRQRRRYWADPERRRRAIERCRRYDAARRETRRAR